jgi:hypothetical protein
MTTMAKKAAGGKGKVGRIVNWLMPPRGRKHGVLKLGKVYPRKGEVSEAYYAELLEADYGIGVRITKLVPTGDTYAVNIHPVTGEHSCECKGWLGHGHCHHVEGLLALYNAGRWF